MLLSWRELACQWATNCLLFPSIFFEAYPHHYTPIRCCAQRLGRHYPPIYYSGGAKHENDKTLYKCMKRISDATGPQKLSSRSNESSIFMFFYNSRQKKCEKICQQILPKLSSRLHESSILTILGGSKMTPPRALWTPRWLHVTPKSFLRWDKILPKVQKFCCSGHWHTWKIKSSLSPIDGT